MLLVRFRNSPLAAAFYRAAVEKGFVFSDPRMARTQPGAARAMVEMYQRMAEIGGIPYASEIQISLEGSGRSPPPSRRSATFR